MTDLMTRPDPRDPDGTFDDGHATPPLPPDPPYGGGPPSGDGRWPRRIAGGAAVLVLIGGAGTAGGVLADHVLGSQTPAGSATMSNGVSGTVVESNDLAAIVQKVQPSIVTVMVDGARSASLGSGVVVGADGLVLTNNHVIASDGAVSVRLSDGRTVPARVVATDTRRDLALVRASGLSGLTPVTFGNDDSVAVGDTVLAFGAPLGLANTVTAGIVSAQGRSVDTGDEKLSGLLQTDAAINEGNSGGALVDLSGHVIGINVAIATAGQTSGGSIGVGFAIPAGTVVSVVGQLQGKAR